MGSRAKSHSSRKEVGSTRSPSASPKDYEAFFDEVAEVARHLNTDSWDDIEKTRRLVERAANALPPGRAPEEPAGLTDIIASRSLSGGAHPCSAMGCRVKSASAGARFAALYAERIWIRDPFESLAHHTVDDVEYVESALASLASFQEWKPLLLAGIASHFAPVCASCAAKRVTENELLNTPVQDLGLELLDRIVTAGHATVRREDSGEVVVEVDLPSRYTGHRRTICSPTGSNRIRIVRFLGKRNSREVPKRGRIAADAFGEILRPTLHEALVQAMHRGLSGGTYASNLEVDLELAATTSSDAKDAQDAVRLLRALRHAVPIVENVPVSTVMRLRAEDEGSFQLYRNRIAALRGEVTDEKKLREASDQLKTEFAALETKIASRKKSLWGGIRDQAKIATGTVVAGMGLWLSHVLSPTWTGIAAAAGGITVAQKVGADLLSSARRSPEEMTHPLYFLWKVKKAGRRSL